MEISIDVPGAYYFGPFRLDPIRRVLQRDNQPVKLPPRLFETLLYLVRNAGRVVEKDELMSAVWSGRTVEETNLSQTIFSLRKVLATDGDADRYIVTAPSRGYRFAATVRLELEADERPVAARQPPAPPAAAPQPAAPSLWRRFGLVALLVLAASLAVVVIRIAPRLTEPAFAPPLHSVAVLPFTNMSGDPSQDYYGDGLAEELINALSRLPAVRVAARVSAFSFRHEATTVTEIGRRLNVGTILEGSVRRGANILRISAQLVDARTGFQLWSRSFDRDPRDLLAMEGEIAAAVAGSLQVSLLQDEAARLTLGGTNVPEAFDAYLHGMQLLRSNDDASIARAQADFDRAIQLDPKYARAYAGRAYTLCDIGMNPPLTATQSSQSQTFAEALSAADTSIALAPDLAAGHAARGAVLDNGFMKPAEAAAEATRARELEPGNAAIVGNYAEIAADLGHSDDAITAARLAASLDPLRPDVWYLLGMIEYQARHYDDAAVALQHEKQLRGSLPAHSMELLARVQLLRGDLTGAAQSCKASTAEYVDICLAMVEHARGDMAAAQAAIDRLKQSGRDDATYNFAEIYAQWRDHASALSWLEQAFKQHDQVLGQILADPLLDPIRDEPRFKEVVRQLNLPP
jgi:TolB-like protein/DNA-binding winged helix-turn-helix (wHTH) protein/Tfp pilus assembly protein PilF